MLLKTIENCAARSRRRPCIPADPAASLAARLVLGLYLIGWSITAGAEPPVPPTPNLSAIQLSERIDFIERSLDANRDAVSLWQNGWSVIYGSATAGYLGLAVDSDDSDDRALHLAGALRAASAYTLLQLRPHPGRYGADPLRNAEFDTEDARLDAAEALFAASARRAASRGRPARHLRNVAMNLGFGMLVWAFGDSDDVLPFTLMGIAGGEAVLLTLPKGSVTDYDAYRSRHASTSKRPWRLVAIPGGLAFEAPLPF